jgi:glycosyltransferase involved in cell wall biosynthesis
MRICYLANAASIHTRRWASHFAERGHEVSVISLTNARIPGVEVRCIGLDPNVWGRLSYPLAVPPLRNLLRRLKPDVLHAHYAGGYGLTAALCGFRPLALTAWGSDVLILPRVSRLMRALVQLSLRRADLVTSMAQHMTAAIYGLGVAEGRVVTLPFGVDRNIFRGRPAGAREKGDGQTIVSTRHMEPVYNLGLLVEALPEITAAVPAVKVILIGEGSERGRLQNRVRELGLDRQALFLGAMQPGEIAARLSQADVFVSTSLSDGNNISLNEAMACGAFPIATDIPANREWIRHGENGFLTHLHDHRTLAALVIQALRRGPLRADAAAMNYDIIERRGSWVSAMEVMEEQYLNLIQQGASPQPIRAAAGVQQ